MVEALTKVPLCIEHADGRQETIHITLGMALVIIRRLLVPGWPHCTPIYNGTRITKQGHASNVFLGDNGEEIIL